MWKLRGKLHIIQSRVYAEEHSFLLHSIVVSSALLCWCVCLVTRRAGAFDDRILCVIQKRTFFCDNLTLNHIRIQLCEAQSRYIAGWSNVQFQHFAMEWEWEWVTAWSSSQYRDVNLVDSKETSINYVRCFISMGGREGLWNFVERGKGSE